MTFTVHTSTIRTIKNTDPLYFIHDRLMISPRAGIEIDKRCPTQYQQMIATALDLGWIKPVAHVTEQEYMWMALGKE
jgi:hypothetical protein